VIASSFCLFTTAVLKLILSTLWGQISFALARHQIKDFTFSCNSPLTEHQEGTSCYPEENYFGGFGKNSQEKFFERLI